MAFMWGLFEVYLALFALVFIEGIDRIRVQECVGCFEFFLVHRI